MPEGPPRISIITPSFNQGVVLEECISSIADQNYSNLEHIVIDGGSSDNTSEILVKCRSRLTYCVSEPDGGQYHALNKGFAKATGDILAWLNCDDKYLPWTLQTVSEIFTRFPDISWVTSLFPLSLDSRGTPLHCRSVDGYSRQGFFRGENLAGGDWPSHHFIQQESTFWRRSLWEKCGSTLNTKLKYAADFELWARFFSTGAELHGVALPLAGFRVHEAQQSQKYAREYLQESREALLVHGGKTLGKWDSFLLEKSSKLQTHFAKRYRRRFRLNEEVRTCARDTNGTWQIYSHR